MPEDDAILQYAAGRRLAALYDAYRASSRANVLVQRRIAGHPIEAGEPADLRAEILRRSALSHESDLAFARRAADVRARLPALREEWARP